MSKVELPAEVNELVAGLVVATLREFEREGFTGDQRTVLAAIGEGFRIASMLHLHAPESADEMARWYEDEDARDKATLDAVAAEWVEAAHMLARGEVSYDHFVVTDPPSRKETDA